MRQPIRVLLQGFGLVGRDAAASVLTRQGLQLVGVIDRHPDKQGLDIGPLLGDRGDLGIKIESDIASAVARLRPDVALHIVSSTVEEAIQEIAPLIEAGVDIVSSNEELGNAFASKAGLAAELDTAAVRAGITILGTGFSPGWATDYLILAITGGCRDIEHIHYSRVADSRAYIGSVVAGHFGLGLTKTEFDRGVENGEIVGHIALLESAKTIADRLGWRVQRFERTMTPELNRDGDRVQASITSVRAFVDGRERLLLDLKSSFEKGVEGGDTLVVDAHPPIRMVMKPQVSSVFTTSNAIVNAIPHVINAKPGLLTVGDMPLIHALECDARLLLAD